MTPTLEFPDTLPDPRAAITKNHFDAYRAVIREVGADLYRLGIGNPRALANGGQVSSLAADDIALSWTFTYQPMHLTTTVAVLDWFLRDVAGLWGRPLRVLSPGTGPASEALALHMLGCSPDLDFLGLDHNPGMLRLGQRMLEHVGAMTTGRQAPPKLSVDPDHPSVIGHLRRGALTQQPLLVLTSHVLSQNTLAPRTLGSWARCISEGLGEAGGWLVIHEPKSDWLDNEKLVGLRQALRAEGVVVTGEAGKSSAVRAWTDYDMLVELLRFQAGQRPTAPRRPWITWKAEPVDCWLLAAELRRA
jgi:hypothetical protein